MEYKGFTNVGDDAREYAFVVKAAGGFREYRYNVPLAALTAAGVPMQDAKDVCYRALARDLAAASNRLENKRTLSAEELTSYRADHPDTPWRSFTALRGDADVPQPEKKPRRARGTQPPA